MDQLRNPAMGKPTVNHVAIGPSGARTFEEGAFPGDLYACHHFGYVGRVMKRIDPYEGPASWPGKIMPLNPQDWKPDDLARAHPIVETPKADA